MVLSGLNTPHCGHSTVESCGDGKNQAGEVLGVATKIHPVVQFAHLCNVKQLNQDSMTERL